MNANEEALKRASDDYLRFAERLGSQIASTGPSAAAFQAGYFALLSALGDEERRALQDHPNSAAARLAAHRLALGAADQQLAEMGARVYYRQDLAESASLADWLAWAARVRMAAGFVRS